MAEAKQGVGLSGKTPPRGPGKEGGPGKEDIPRAAKGGGWIYGWLATKVSNFCSVSVDFARICTFSHPSWMQGDCVPSTNMDGARQGWSIRSHRFGVATRARGLGELLHAPVFSSWHMCSWSHPGESVRFTALLLPHQQARWIQSCLPPTPELCCLLTFVTPKDLYFSRR